MSTTTVPDVDSRCYIFSYLIRSESDLPADFAIPESAKNFQIGVFLPRDDSRRFGRSQYPPRILLLHGGSMLVLTHPHYREEPVRIVLSDLVCCEFGHLLLIGWLRFVTAGCEVRLPYNTRGDRPVNEFLDSLLGVWLGNATNNGDGELADFGPPLDIKFGNHLAGALREQEGPRALWFSPPSEQLWRWGPFRVHSEVGGDLLAVTNTRVIWIRDRWKGWYERYGSVASMAPLRGVESVHWLRSGDKRELTVTLTCGRSWRIPVAPAAYEAAEAFAETVTGYSAEQSATDQPV